MAPGTSSASGSRRLAFAGTPEFAATILAGLLAAQQRPIMVLTQPDRPAGRGRRMQPSPVKALALAHGLPVETPARLRTESALALLRDLALDVLVVAAYGLILPRSMLALPVHGCINVHASLLPRWRGAAPIEHAIMAGDRETGVSIMQMDAGLDTGAVYLRRSIPIEPDATGDRLRDQLAQLGSDALLDVLAHLDSAIAEPQDDTGATYAPKLSSADAVLDWTQPAELLERRIRALYSRLPAVAFRAGERIRVLGAELAGVAGGGAPPGTVLTADRRGIIVACGSGTLCITRLQLTRGKARPLGVAEALNGYPDLFRVGVCFDAGG
jgi:methionyl-tRNA formyltransferase